MNNNIKLILVGILSIFIDVFLFYILNNYITIHYIIFSSVSFVVSLTINYSCYKYLFPNTYKKTNLFVLFLILFIAFCLNSVLTYVLIRKLYIHYIVSKFIIIFILLLYNYFC